MSTNSLTCPKCQATLRLSAPVEPGKKLRCPKCRTVFATPAEEEPQEVVDVPDAVRAAPPKASDDQPEEDRPRKRRPARPPAKPTAPPVARIISYGLLGVALLLALLGYALAGVLGGAISLLLFVLAFGCVATGHIWILVVAFQEQMTSGLLCLLVPLYGLFYARKHQDRAGLGYNLFLVGLVILFFGAGPLTAYLNLRTGPQPNTASGPPITTQPAAGPVDPVTRALAELKAPELQRRRNAVFTISLKGPDERRAEVVPILESLIKDPDYVIQGHAVKALGVWGTKENVPRLIQVLAEEKWSICEEAIDALVMLDDERAIEPIAKQLEGSFREKAGKALRHFGPAAEKPVLPYLSHKDRSVRDEACRVLRAIGTAESLPALQALADNKKDRGMAKMAADAIEDIKARKK
jgi:hypothetical protein